MTREEPPNVALFIHPFTLEERQHIRTEAGRYTANYPDEFTVLFIGMRVNKLWKLSEWVPWPPQVSSENWGREHSPG